MVKALLQKKISIKKWQRRIIHMENKLINTGQNSIMDNFIEADDILKDMRQIIESSQKAAHQAVNMTLVQRNWMMGYRIASEELHGEKRAEYGAKIIKKLSKGINFILIGCIKFYRKFISPMKITPCCRFIPSCSQYAIEALQKYGPLKGSFLAIKRILRCNHFSKGGYDPVP